MSLVGETGAERPVVGENELYSVVHTSGSDSRYQLEGRIRFNKADVHNLDSQTRNDLRALVDHQRWEYNYVSFPFDLDEQEAGHYERVAVTVSFRDQRVIARYLSPDRDNTFVPYEGVASTWGLGRSEMRWQLDPADGAEQVRPRGHTVMCLVQRPKDLADVELSMNVQVTIVQTIFVFHRRIAAVREPSHFRLSFAENTFERLST